MLGDSISINLSCTFEKKIDKTSNKKMFCILWAQSPHQKRGHNFLLPENKSISPACTNFLFYQNIICFGWVSYKSFSILSDIFRQKSVISSMHPYIARVMYVWLQHIKKISWKFHAQILNSFLITAVFMQHRKCTYTSSCLARAFYMSFTIVLCQPVGQGIIFICIIDDIFT